MVPAWARFDAIPQASHRTMRARSRAAVPTRLRVPPPTWELKQNEFSSRLIPMRLRKKVDDGFSTKLVRTQRGCGYCVAPPGE